MAASVPSDVQICVKVTSELPVDTNVYVSSSGGGVGGGAGSINICVNLHNIQLYRFGINGLIK